MNYTISVPEGTTNHGNPHLLCTPARWYDYILFVFANYLAHAATVVPIPGQDVQASIFAVVLALMLPGSAVLRSVAVILRRAATEQKDPLKCAARAGALCIVLKKPKTGNWAKHFGLKRAVNGDMEGGKDEADGIAIQIPGTEDETSEIEPKNTEAVEHQIQKTPTPERPPSTSSMPGIQHLPGHDEPAWHNPPLGYEPIPAGSQIHGEYWLHKDYYLALVPPVGLPNLALDVGQDPPPVEGRWDLETPEFRHPSASLSSSYNFVKTFIGLLQSIWAFITVYRARGDQIEQFGYAAFGLTVAPYATMSIVNTIANMLTPQYPSLFVVRTPMLTALESQNKARFQGALAVVESPGQKAQQSGWPSRLGAWLDDKALSSTDRPVWNGKAVVWPSILLSLVPLAIVGGLSGFGTGSSTSAERGFTMSWLVLGILSGVGWSLMLNEDSEIAQGYSSNILRTNGVAYSFTIALFFGAPVFGGMAMVGKMIHEFGVCTLLRE